MTGRRMPCDPSARSANEVYPRVCGGTVSCRLPCISVRGLSPRVRGNRRSPEQRPVSRRSIPACAGEPPPPLPEKLPVRVYPRVCGGARLPASAWRCSSGLSPRVRGSPHSWPTGLPGPGSIPACAGEPHLHAYRELWHQVYPRVCGGAGRSHSTFSSMNGLSPRVRGSRVKPWRSLLLPGSIPACAGEPSYPHIPKPYCWVYPRVCGGAGPFMVQ